MPSSRPSHCRLVAVAFRLIPDQANVSCARGTYRLTLSPQELRVLSNWRLCVSSAISTVQPEAFRWTAALQYPFQLRSTGEEPALRLPYPGDTSPSAMAPPALTWNTY